MEHVQSILKQDFSTEAIASGLISQSKQWEEWVDKNTEAGLAHVFAYQNSKREQFKQPLFQMLMHLFNHQTYHRGQIVTMLRLAGIEEIPATDFIVWSRKK